MDGTVVPVVDSGESTSHPEYEEGRRRTDRQLTET